MVKTERKFTGRDAAFVFVGCFVVIIIVNVVLTIFAVRSFPGIDIDNAYVASQEFDAQRERQEALGWVTDVVYENNEVQLILNDQEGRPVSPNAVALRVGRATTDNFDTTLDLRFNGEAFVAEHELAGGKWLAFIDATAPDGTPFYQMQEICVPFMSSPGTANERLQDGCGS